MQQLIDFTSIARKQCVECRKLFDPDDLNHYETCERCTDMLAAQADILSDYHAKQLPPVSTSSYGAERMALPGSNRRRALDGNL